MLVDDEVAQCGWVGSGWQRCHHQLAYPLVESHGIDGAYRLTVRRIVRNGWNRGFSKGTMRDFRIGHGSGEVGTDIAGTCRQRQWERHDAPDCHEASERNAEPLLHAAIITYEVVHMRSSRVPVRCRPSCPRLCLENPENEGFSLRMDSFGCRHNGVPRLSLGC